MKHFCNTPGVILHPKNKLIVHEKNYTITNTNTIIKYIIS